MSERKCLRCGCAIAHLHFNAKRCPPCAREVAEAKERQRKKIVLAPDAVTCPVCKRRMNCITAGHFRKHGYPTAQVFKRTFSLDTLKAPSLCQDHSQYMRKNSPTKGKTRTLSERRRMRQNRRGKGVGVCGKYERTPEIRARISAGVTKYLLSREGDFARGWFVYSEKLDDAVYVRSSWEERVVAVFDLHPCVEWFETEPFSIPYFFAGVTRRYVPDFLLWLEGGIKEVWEVKPEEFLKLAKNQAKIAALNDYTRQRGYNARVVRLVDIEGMEMQVGLRPWRGCGQPWVRLDDPSYRPGGEANAKP